MSAATVTGALRRFLPEFLNSNPPLSQQQRRAIWAITHCRTPALGGRSFACERCGQVHFAFSTFQVAESRGFKGDFRQWEALLRIGD